MRPLFYSLAAITLVCSNPYVQTEESKNFFTEVHAGIDDFEQANFRKALKHFQEAKEYFDEIDNDEMKIACLIYIYDCQTHVSNFLDLQQTASEIFNIIDRKKRIYSKKNVLDIPFENTLKKGYANSIDRPCHEDHAERESYSQEAADHYDKARELAMKGVIHSIKAGMSVYSPVNAITDVLEGSKCFVEAAMEYNKGVECERKGKK